jgi:hypothetical protein
MKDKKNGKIAGFNSNLTNSPLATSTTEKDDLTHHSYQHQGYYQSQVAYNPTLTTNYYNTYPPLTSYDNYYYHHQQQQQQSDPMLASFI